MLTGEEIAEWSQDEFEAKYNRIVEAVKSKFDLNKFSFTPGDEFMKASDDELIEALTSSIERLMAGDLEIISDEDLD